MAEYIDRTQIKWYGCDHEGKACIPSGGHCEKCFFGTCNHDEVMSIKPADVVERSKINAAIEEIKQLKRFELRGNITPLVNGDNVVDILNKILEV